MAKDFRNKTFPKILRGYAPDEVDEYIARINTEYGRLERKLAETEKKLAAAVEKLDKADRKNGGEEEAGMRAAADAKETAAKIIGEAQKTADGIIKQAEKRAGEIEEEARKLSERVYSFRDMLFEAYNNHIEDIERVMGEVDALTGRGDDIRDDESGESDEDGESEDTPVEDTSVEDSREPKTSFIGGDLYIDPDEYADAADSDADAKEEERRRRLDRLFGIPDSDDGDVTNDSDLTNDSDSFGSRNCGINIGVDSDNNGIDAGESANDSDGDGDGDTRVLDLGELLRENRKASAEAEKVSAPSASDSDGASDEDGDFSVAQSGGEFSDFSSDEIDSILGKKVRALTDEFGVVYSDDRLPHEKKGKKGKGRR